MSNPKYQGDTLAERAFNLALHPLARLIDKVTSIKKMIGDAEREFDGTADVIRGLREAAESPTALKKLESMTLNLDANSEEEAEWLKDSDATYQMFREYVQELRDRLDALDCQLEANARKFRDGLRSDLQESHRRREAA